MSPIEIVIASIILGWGWGELTAPEPQEPICPQIEMVDGKETVIPYLCKDVLPTKHPAISTTEGLSD